MSSADDPARTIRLNVPILTRLEGEGGLTLSATKGRLQKVALNIYEPPRFFEKFLEDKAYYEQPTIAARICGICPIAYQITGIRAIESAFELTPSPWVKQMRRLTQCGEWLQSHALHIHFLAMPDLLGYEHMLAMSQDHPQLVRRGLSLQALGNNLLTLFGGRSVHPLGLKVGGFHSAPAKARVQALLPLLEQAEQDARDLLAWLADQPLIESQQDFVYVALNEGQHYPMNEGNVLTSLGDEISPAEYRDYFKEHQQPHSTALYSLYRGKPYLVGPLARMNLHFEKLPEPVKQLAGKLGMHFPSFNMHHSIWARALECYFCVLEARRLLRAYQPQTPALTVQAKAGWAAHCSEAPRGLIYHHYRLDDRGIIKAVCIIPPTSQNQARIEQDLRLSLQAYGLEHSDEELKFHCERLIRNYDPCISCSVHFLKLKVNRS